MTYRVEITASSISELAGKLAALATQMNSPTGGPVTNVVNADNPERRSPEDVADAALKTAEQVAAIKARLQVERATAQAEMLKAQEASQTIDQTIALGKTDAPASEPVTAPASDAPSDKIVYEKDVAPLVIKLVGAKGKASAMSVLEAFGVSNAREVPAEQWVALIEALNEALGA